MEYTDRGDLYQKIVQFKKCGCLIEETDVWSILIQMVRGLKALHDLKILHRDLKNQQIYFYFVMVQLKLVIVMYQKYT